MRNLLSNWAKIVFVVLPLSILAIDAAILFAEWRQSDSQKAIRLVKESKSRKENFTVQQYLYATLYHRRDQGAEILIEGWRAEADPASPGSFSISFTYRDARGEHTALWLSDLTERKVIPKNQPASDLSW
jgi:hypothetical protein